MEKTIKIKSIIGGLLIALCILIVLDVIPFLFIWTGVLAKNSSDEITLQKWAVKTSVFRFQKIYTRNNLLPQLVLTGDYVTAINYFKELEDLDGADSLNTRLAIYSYIKTGDYDNALMYASLINDRTRLAQIYIQIKDYVKANIVLESLLKEDSAKASTYLYKGEVLLHEGKYQEANNFADKALEKAPNYIDALYLKSKVCTKLGRVAESKKYFSQAKYLESKREEYYK